MSNAAAPLEEFADLLAGACQQREGGLLTQEQFTRRITLLRIGKEDLFPGVMSQFWLSGLSCGK